jgi:hypothetical protein
VASNLLFPVPSGRDTPAAKQGAAMRWSMFGRGEGERDQGAARAAGEVPDRAHVEAALAKRGVGDDLCPTLASRIESRLSGRSATEREALLDGVAIASVLHQETSGRLEKSLRGLREVERMMGAFSGELSKLDEVLEVLAAYVQRMRTTGAAESERTLH